MSNAFQAAATQRYAFIDVIKGVAILAMIVYHAAFDLSLFNLFGVSIIYDFGWTVFARAIAATFIGMAGVNLVLAHARGFKTGRFLRRIAILAAAAAAVSLVTFLSDRSTFVFFGILHQIALASLLGAALLRVPSVILAPAAAIFIALPFLFVHPAFNMPFLWWVGLSSDPPVSIDYVPFFPWFGVALAGMVAGRLFLAYGAQSSVASWDSEAWLARFLKTAGRWSLVIYVVHQPILYGLIYAVAAFVPPDIDSARSDFNAQCRPACAAQGSDEATCTPFCNCMFDGLYDTDLYTITAPEQMTPDQATRWDELLRQCVGAPAPTQN